MIIAPLYSYSLMLKQSPCILSFWFTPAMSSRFSLYLLTLPSYSRHLSTLPRSKCMCRENSIQSNPIQSHPDSTQPIHSIPILHSQCSNPPTKQCVHLIIILSKILPSTQSIIQQTNLFLSRNRAPHVVIAWKRKGEEKEEMLSIKTTRQKNTSLFIYRQRNTKTTPLNRNAMLALLRSNINSPLSVCLYVCLSVCLCPI